MYYKTAVITGGLGGIGLETCKCLFAEGIESVTLLDIIDDTNEKLELLKIEYPTKNIHYIKLDVTNEAEVKNTFKKIINQMNSIDIFIGTAGISDETNCANLININFLGTVYTTLAAIKVMSKLNGGNGGIIANIASVTALQPFFFSPIYSASKHAVLGFMRSLSDEYYYKKQEIKFITICPGITETPLLRSSKLLFPETTDSMIEKLKDYPINISSEMGSLVTKILLNSDNGKIWIADKLIKEVEMPQFWPLKIV